MARPTWVKLVLTLLPAPIATNWVAIMREWSNDTSIRFCPKKHSGVYLKRRPQAQVSPNLLSQFCFAETSTARRTRE